MNFPTTDQLWSVFLVLGTAALKKNAASHESEKDLAWDLL